MSNFCLSLWYEQPHISFQARANNDCGRGGHGHRLLALRGETVSSDKMHTSESELGSPTDLSHIGSHAFLISAPLQLITVLKTAI